MARDWLVVEARVVGCDAELYLNDIAVGLIGRGQARSIAVPVNQYAVAGQNELAVVVRPGPTPATATLPRPEPEAATGAAVTATLSQYRPNTVSGDGSGVVLATVAWTGKPDDEREVFPQRHAALASVDLDLGPWNWHGADEIALDADTVRAVGQVIDGIRAGLAAGDVRPFLELGTTALREIARAYGDSPETGVSTLRAVVDDGRNAPYWKFPPLPAEQWDLRLAAHGRMVECIAKDWEPIVRSLTDEEDNSFSMPLFVGRSSLGWTVLR